MWVRKRTAYSYAPAHKSTRFGPADSSFFTVFRSLTLEISPLQRIRFEDEPARLSSPALRFGV